MSFKAMTHAVLMQSAAVHSALLPKVDDAASREYQARITESIQKVQKLRVTIATHRQQLGELGATTAAQARRLKLAIAGGLSFGQALGITEVEDLRLNRGDDLTAADRLELIFKGHGEFGHQISRRLRSFADELETSRSAQESAIAQLARIELEYSTEFFALQGAVATAKSILANNRIVLPKVNTLGGRPKKGKADKGARTAPVAALPALAPLAANENTPAPAKEVA